MFNNFNSTLKKVLVIFLIITLTYANLALIGVNIVNSSISFATGESKTTETVKEESETIKEEQEIVENEKKPLLNIENRDIHKTTISEENEIEYSENLKININYITEKSDITIKDSFAKFYNLDKKINENIKQKYNSTIINKVELLTLLGETGKIVISNVETEKILAELTKDIIENQKIDEEVEQKFIVNEETKEEETRTKITVTEENIEIKYIVDVENIKVELTNIDVVKESKTTESKTEESKTTEGKTEEEKNEVSIKNTKTIYNLESIENLDYLEEKITYIINEEEEVELDSIIKFKDTITRATLNIDNTNWVLGETNTAKYTITLDTSSEKAEMFVNPMFLIELPSSVESINTEGSQFTVNNDMGAFTNKKVFITTVLGRRFIVIMLEGKQTEENLADEDATIEITLELNIASEAENETETTKLYYQNDTVTAYESGKSFDTISVTVNMVMESEPKEEISEVITGNEEEPIEENNMTLIALGSTEDIIEVGDEFKYYIYVYNDSSEDKENLQLTSTLPEGISIKKIVDVKEEDNTEKKVEYTFDEETRVLTINIDKIEKTVVNTYSNEETEEHEVVVESYGARKYEVTVKADELPEDVYSREIKTVIKLKQGDEILAESSEIINTISDSKLIIEYDELDDELDELEEFTLGIKIINKGLINKTGVNVSIEVPEEISLLKYAETILNEKGEEIGSGSGTISGNFEANKDVNSLTSCYLQINGKVKELNGSKQVTIKGTINGNDVEWTLKLVDLTVDPDNPDNSGGTSGTNKPGSTEQPDNTGNAGNTGETGNTGNNGSTGNPNTDLPTDNEKQWFDLSLNQYLNKATVVNSKGTTTYEYKDTNFAKIEIHSKQMNGSKVTLEYKIVVKNEGTIPGKARKVVVYMPEGLQFNEELNEDWYLGDDGNIYSVALIDKLLSSGETAELTVILEKEMTNENVGTITTLAEIYEATNDKNVEDINSIPGDKLDGQNDMSKVEVIIATSTGTIIMYTILSVLVLAIIGFGFYKVKKITLNKKGGC